jgi:hypothetical protein
MENARGVQDLVQRLIDQDQKRSKVRAKVDGLVGGNPPYSAGKLRDAGRADACNANWGTARSYLEAAVGAFYDLFSQAPGFVQVETSHGNSENRIEWSRIMSKKVDLLVTNDSSWRNQVQLSIGEMVLHGTGPMFFDDAHCVFPRAIETGNLLLPDRTPSDIDRWEIGTVLFDYYPPELFAFIENEEAAKDVGWYVDNTKDAIQMAMDQKTPDNRTYNWEWYATELKTNSFDYVDSVKIIKLAHVFWREFPEGGNSNGRITQAIVQRNDTAAKGVKYLFRHIGRYENFQEAVHAIYFDRGQGGYHHSVTGLGVKLYSALEYENRLIGNLMDKAFAPKILFKPTTPAAKEKFQMARYGDWGLVPPGTEALQTPIQGFLTDGLAMFRTSSDLLRSNLSQYRQNVAPEKPGNPDTKFKVQLDAAQESALSNTTYSRFYDQMDALYHEIVRRVFNLNTTDPKAKMVQKQCRDEGVPEECFGRIESVKAVRVVGMGSPFMRQQTLQTIGQYIQRAPEQGQQAWFDDFIAAQAGQSAVDRYNPKSKMSQLVADQKERAGNQITGMRAGKPADFSPSQNAITFAGVYLQACTQAIQSVQKGADMKTVVAFLSLCGPAAAQHIQRLKGDPARAEVGHMLEEQLKKVGKITDELKKRLQKQAEQQKMQQKKTQSALTDDQIKTRKLIGDEKRKNAKTQFQIQRDKLKTQSSLAIADATAASQIHLNRLRAFRE